MATRQLLDARKETPIVIETPMGFIKITRTGHRRKKHQLTIELPDGVKAVVGEDRAKDGARYVDVDESGRVTPKYSVLVPVLDEGGELVDVRPQRPVRLAKMDDSMKPASVRVASM